MQPRQMGEQDLGQGAVLEVVRGERVIGGAQAVLQGEVKRGRRLADARDADQDEVRLVEALWLQAIVERKAEIDRVDARFVVVRHAVGASAAGDGGTAERGFDCRGQQVENVEQRDAGLTQKIAQFGAGQAGKHQRAGGCLDPRDRAADLLRTVEERQRNQAKLEVGKLRQHALRHCLDGDAGVIGNAEDRMAFHWGHYARVG